MPQRSFQKILEDTHPVIIDLVSSIIKPQANEISKEFYRAMLENKETEMYLQNSLVEAQLAKSFTNWAAELFGESAQFDSNLLANRQLLIGKVHARIGIPMQLVDYGMQVVKDYCFRAFLATNHKKSEISDSIIFINNLLDTALTTINQSYFESTIDNERNAQLLRLKMASSDLNVECERVKYDLLTWSRDVLSSIVSKSNESFFKISNIYQTNFGLWINHKAVFYFSDFEELQKIKTLLFKLDEICLSGNRIDFDEKSEAIVKFTECLNETVNEIAWLLSQIIERNTKENQSKDPLTNLLSRRYMDSILKREVEISIKQNQKFAVLMVDVDNFKNVNDTYGHACGDSVLRDTASVILQCVRPTDFCFRYGGEELVIVLTSMNERETQTKAENIRRSIENYVFYSKDSKQIPITISVGAAVHDGHPDYQKTVDLADQNLYEAKRGGRNKVVIG